MKYRHEWKFNVSDSELTMINNKISRLLSYDEHINNNGIYFIHSLYFDDYANTCMKDNDAGVNKRYKWRIRYYNNNLDYICLERKEKNNGLTRKKMCQISMNEYINIINNNMFEVFWNTNYELLKEFCFDISTRLFRPKIIIDYERCAFVEPICNIRITFDKSITASKEVDKFLIGNYTKTPIQNINENIMEVKFDDILPSHIKQATYLNSLEQITFSKYYLGRSMLERS